MRKSVPSKLEPLVGNDRLQNLGFCDLALGGGGERWWGRVGERGWGRVGEGGWGGWASYIAKPFQKTIRVLLLSVVKLLTS